VGRATRGAQKVCQSGDHSGGHAGDGADRRSDCAWDEGAHQSRGICAMSHTCLFNRRNMTWQLGHDMAIRTSYAMIWQSGLVRHSGRVR
jgi:hypothetical protein